MADYKPAKAKNEFERNESRELTVMSRLGLGEMASSVGENVVSPVMVWRRAFTGLLSK